MVQTAAVNDKASYSLGIGISQTVHLTRHSQSRTFSSEWLVPGDQRKADLKLKQPINRRPGPETKHFFENISIYRNLIPAVFVQHESPYPDQRDAGGNPHMRGNPLGYATSYIVVFRCKAAQYYQISL
jgi:hypothetical protein